ncbi:MAG: phosphoribosyltransferase family protein, partial [Candidatus Cloacimonadota bacterium]|nr:phosphoribosyltransferase family protein [Candidatus Cloacimonadota bacterium]
VVKIRKDIDTEIENKHVLVVEDIVDSGLTLKYLLEYLQKHNPASVKSCVLLDKPEAHSGDIHLDYVGFEVGNEFMVGYGLDYAQKYRNLPFIGVLKEEIYN